jgi:TIR domain
MADVFLSYASKDKQRVKPLVAILERAGWSVFWDDRLRFGSSWGRKLEIELRSARAVVVAWSSKSAESDWVRDEAGRGADRGILFPVLLDHMKPPLGSGAIQTVDLSRWNGREYCKELDEFVRGLALHFGGKASRALKKATGLVEPAQSQRDLLMRVLDCPSAEILTVLRWFQGSTLATQRMLGANSHAERFYGMLPGQFTRGQSLLSMLERLQPWMEPSDYAKFMTDQEDLVKALNEGTVIFAKEPMRFGSNHPFSELRNRTYKPIAVATSKRYRLEGVETLDALLTYVSLDY